MVEFEKTRNALSRELWYLFDHTLFAISRLREIELEQYDLTIAQSYILFTLRGRGGTLTLQELEKDGMRQHHSVSTLINRMAEMGMVNKEKKPDDKKFRISISKEGEELLNKVTYASLDLTFSVLTAKQKLNLAGLVVPLLDQARFMLEQSQASPFLQQLNSGNEKRKQFDLKEVSDFILWTLLDRFGFAITRLLELELARFGITPAQEAILDVIGSHGGEINLQELEEKRMRQHHSIFIIINRMVKMGLVEQVRNPQDRRYKIVMTEKGKKVKSEVTIDSLNLTFSVLSLEQQRQLVTSLTPLQDKARYLLGVTVISPFMQYLIYGDSNKKGPMLPNT